MVLWLRRRTGWLRDRSAFCLTIHRPDVWMRTVSTINSNPHAHSATHVECSVIKKLETHRTIMITAPPSIELLTTALSVRQWDSSIPARRAVMTPSPFACRSIMRCFRVS